MTNEDFQDLKNRARDLFNLIVKVRDELSGDLVAYWFVGIADNEMEGLLKAENGDEITRPLKQIVVYLEEIYR